MKVFSEHPILGAVLYNRFPSWRSFSVVENPRKEHVLMTMRVQNAEQRS